MKSHQSILELSQAGTIVDAQAIRARLLAALAEAQGPVLHLDLSRVERADVTLVQLLLATETAALAAHRRLRVDASPGVAALLARAGLAGWPGAAAS